MTLYNPWIKRFEQLYSIDTIKALSYRPAQPLIGLLEDPLEVACGRIQRELDEVFVATARSCEIMRFWVGTSLDHAKQRYPSVRAFIRTIYEQEIEFNPVMPMLFTGPPGTGKSQLCKGLLRVLGEASTIKPDPDHGTFPLVAANRLVVKSKKSISEIIRPLAKTKVATGARPPSVRNLIADCHRWQYSSGVCLLMLDELQSLTQSSDASALIASVILEMTYFGIPTLIIGNYSLLHRLLKRPQEEQQRMLGRPILLLPDPPESKDWIDVLKEYQRALPEVFSFNLSERSFELWSYCAGLKRELVKLIVLSYKQIRENKGNQVRWQDIEYAYHSFEFAAQRKDIEMLIAHEMGSTNLRLDMQCPLELPKNMLQSYNDALKTCRESKLGQSVVRFSMTKEERKIIDNYDQKLQEVIVEKPKFKKISDRQKVSADSLIAATHRIKKK